MLCRRTATNGDFKYGGGDRLLSRCFGRIMSPVAVLRLNCVAVLLKQIIYEYSGSTCFDP
jgi:hypothetical protein